MSKNKSINKLKGISIKTLTLAVVVGYMFANQNLTANAEGTTPTTDAPYTQYSNAYSLVKTENTGANILPLTIYNETSGIASQNYELKLNLPEYKVLTPIPPASTEDFSTYTLSGVNGVNGGTFTVNALYNYSRSTINIDPDQSGVTIENLTFKDNTVGVPIGPGPLIGGAITIADGSYVKQIKNSNFLNNSNGYAGYGGALYVKEGSIDTIEANFIGNRVTWYGGAISVGDTDHRDSYISSVGLIKGDFIGNRATNSTSYGGAICNWSKLDNIEGNFIGNSAKHGGAIYNWTGTIQSIKGAFIGNKANNGYGGAIVNILDKGDYTKGSINSIEGDFIGNSAYNYGGAIVTFSGSIESVKGNFIANSAGQMGGAVATINSKGNITTISDSYFNKNTAGYYGGAIYNYDTSTMTSITADFIENAANYYGGAICNMGTIKGAIDGTFIKNRSGDSGGAICNTVDYNGDESLAGYGEIHGSITGTFKENSSGYGGAIYNNALIKSDINAIFEKNTALGNGGAISNELVFNSSGVVDFGEIESNIIGTFTDNQANYNGGAINNESLIDGYISGSFESNKAGALGGAIYNQGNGLFGETLTISNSSFNKNEAQSGGAIASAYDIDIIANGYNSVFSENSANKGDDIYLFGNAGAELTMRTINNGTITSNGTIYADNARYNAYFTGDSSGKIALNNKVINFNAASDTITLKIGTTGVDTENNSVSDVFKDSTLDVQSGNVDVLDGKYTANNFEKLTSSDTARYSIDLLLSKEEQNADTFVVGSGSKGIIYLQTVNVTSYPDDDEEYIVQIIKAPTDDIQLDYDDSKVVKNITAKVSNDMIYGNDFGLATTDTTNDSIIVRGFKDLMADWLELDTDEEKEFTFVNGSDYILSRDVKQVIGDSITITGSNGNTVHVNGKKFIPTISDTQTVTITDAIISKAPEITNNGTLIISGGGLLSTDVVNDSTITITNGSLESLKLENNNGATVTSNGTTITSTQIDNSGQIDITDGTITSSTINNEDGTLSLTSTTVSATNITNDAEITTTDSTLNNSTIDNNKTLTVNGGQISGGSISNSDTITLNGGTIKDTQITEDGTLYTTGTSYIVNTEVDNKVNNTGTLALTDTTLNSELTNDGTSTLEGSTLINNTISGSGNGVLNVKTGTFNIEHDISGQNIVNHGSIINLTDLPLINDKNNSITMKDGIFNIADLGLNNLNLNALNMQGGTLNIGNVNVDLAKETMGRIIAPNSEDATGGSIVVKNMILNSDSKKHVTDVHFADSAFSNQVTTDIHTIYSKIAKYNVSYSGSTGDFTFTRPSGSDGYNPAVLTSSVASSSAAYAGMARTYQEAFNHMDLRMFFSKAERMAQREANKYAIADESSAKMYLDTERDYEGIWFRPYASFDNVALRGGPKVKNFSYGSFIGGDSKMKIFKNGWDGVLSAYVSYMGNHDSYNNTHIYQNGGVLGLTGTFYKDNFFTGVTITSGAGVAEASTMFGHEDFPMLMSGVATKTGYNFEFKNGGYILQPTMLLSYTMVNTFDYTNAAGVKISSSPLHAIQISPNLRFIKTTKRHWQPYLTVGMRWNVMDISEFKANNDQLPHMSEKPYVEYGVGIHRSFKDNLCALGQVTVRNGGRNGIAALFSFKYLMGRDKPQKVKNGNPTHTVIKQPTLIKSI